MKTANVCCYPAMLHFLAKIVCLIFFLFVYCEFLIYYFVLLGCSWPQLSKIDQDFSVRAPNDPYRKPLHVMFIADTHLLGSREGHWLDKLRREWQMYRSFQSARFLFEPHVIFFLGDLTDEGKWCSDHEWEKTVRRFNSLFSVPTSTKLYALAGNHDIGFHYDVSDGRLERFEKSFQAPHVRLITIDDDDINFILVNSMAFEGDQCRLCARAEKELNEIVNELHRSGLATKPVFLSHFPLYRASDANCSLWRQPSLSQSTRHKERYDVLSREASDNLLKKIKPRLVFTAHTHDFCYTEHTDIKGKVIPEWTVPSFSWRNRDDPSFMLLSITTNNERVSHCRLPRESTVFWSYGIGAFLLIFYILFGGRRPLGWFAFCFLRKRIKL
ncbi:unnamed protein product [Rotaria magnacalcarata]|uniref:Calcineurin-like phosphoesterase domain-containing protein n=5 Tax=Rotaria magnacalcarata TaxID=392030 RepID=A0A816N6U9_9BILA|nr:unnamed protein product [Rotaria magnacalcarata]CAF2123420.1 unnamed protein product [Rotaria magnacalcarata]